MKHILRCFNNCIKQQKNIKGSDTRLKLVKKIFKWRLCYEVVKVDFQKLTLFYVASDPTYFTLGRGHPPVLFDIFFYLISVFYITYTNYNFLKINFTKILISLLMSMSICRVVQPVLTCTASTSSLRDPLII